MPTYYLPGCKCCPRDGSGPDNPAAPCADCFGANDNAERFCVRGFAPGPSSAAYPAWAAPMFSPASFEPTLGVTPTAYLYAGGNGGLAGVFDPASLGGGGAAGCGSWEYKRTAQMVRTIEQGSVTTAPPGFEACGAAVLSGFALTSTGGYRIERFGQDSYQLYVAHSNPGGVGQWYLHVSYAFVSQIRLNYAVDPASFVRWHGAYAYAVGWRGPLRATPDCGAALRAKFNQAALAPTDAAAYYTMQYDNFAPLPDAIRRWGEARHAIKQSGVATLCIDAGSAVAVPKPVVTFYRGTSGYSCAAPGGLSVAAAAAEPRAARVALPLRPPCRDLGPVVESCPCNDPARDVRACGSDAADWSRCTRGPNPGADPDIASCEACGEWAAG